MDLGDWNEELGRFPADWETQGDEWLHRFGVEAEQRLLGAHVTGWGLDARTDPFVEVRLQLANDSTLRVLLGPMPGEVFALASGSGQRPDEQTLAVLAKAVQEVGAALGGSGSEFMWEAFIGPSPGRSAHQGHYLAAPTTVGSLHLESAGTVHEEAGESLLPSFSQWSVHRSVPVRVSGISTGYAWEIASMAAARDLRTLCGLLSLASGSEFSVRESPWPVELVRRRVPDKPAWYGSPLSDESDVLPGEAFAAPAWLNDDCWFAARADGWRARALDAYLEGVYAEAKHPSLAAVSYIAAIEAVASRVFQGGRCEQCGTRRGIAKSFRAALRLVLDEVWAAELDAIYNSRSRTVHEGSLHGHETTVGAIFVGVWSADTSRDFRWRTLWRLRLAAGDLVRRALTDDLPPKGPLV